MDYRYGLSDKIIAYMTLISGLVISAVAVWYSVAGLVSIFAASAFSIIVMGVALEVSKLIATVWLKWNWQRAPRLIKVYLITAIAILMLITSMGIFGYLSKAHLDQNLISGDVVDKVAIIDEKIKTQRDNIEAARKALRQMDEAVDQTMARSTSEQGADKAANLRRAQQRERNTLQNDIAKAQAEIARLNEEKAPIAKELRKVEAEVGPIKYIAKLIYGDNPDANILEKAVTWVIIVIVLVFDPLAVVLLLASQYSFQWFKNQKQDTDIENTDHSLLEDQKDQEENITESAKHSVHWPFPSFLKKEENLFDVIKSNEKVQEAPYHPGYEDVAVKDDAGMSDHKFNEKDPLAEWNEMIAEAEKAAEEESHKEDDEILAQATESEKEAMALWKSQNPNDSLKHQRRLLARGIISELPWKTYLKAHPDDQEDEAAIEAAKWAEEQLEAKKKDNDILDGEGGKSSSQEFQRPVGYVQNEEQNQSTIWQRVKNTKKDD